MRDQCDRRAFEVGAELLERVEVGVRAEQMGLAADYGLLIVQVVPGGSAERAGLVLAVSEQTKRDLVDYLEAVAGRIAAALAAAQPAPTIDLAELCSTQPAIVQFGFVQLTDDLATQPAENIAPLVRDDFLAKVPDSAEAHDLARGMALRLGKANAYLDGVAGAADDIPPPLP